MFCSFIYLFIYFVLFFLSFNKDWQCWCFVVRFVEIWPMRRRYFSATLLGTQSGPWLFPLLSVSIQIIWVMLFSDISLLSHWMKVFYKSFLWMAFHSNAGSWLFLLFICVQMIESFLLIFFVNTFTHLFFVLGSLGVLCFDAVVFAQFVYYTRKNELDSSKLVSEGEEYTIRRDSGTFDETDPLTSDVKWFVKIKKNWFI